MAYETCPNCGCRQYDGLCTNCDEECYIQDQYSRDGDSTPIEIEEIAAEQRARRDMRQNGSI